MYLSVIFCGTFFLFCFRRNVFRVSSRLPTLLVTTLPLTQSTDAEHYKHVGETASYIASLFFFDCHFKTDSGAKPTSYQICIDLTFHWEGLNHPPIKQTRTSPLGKAKSASYQSLSTFLSLGTGQVSFLSNKHDTFFP
jgi:hypothetical protein